MIAKYYVEEILNRLGLREINQDSNGWRCMSPFATDAEVPKEERNKSFAINHEGQFKCHRTNKRGNLLTLTTYMKGFRDNGTSMVWLKRENLIEITECSTWNNTLLDKESQRKEVNTVADFLPQIKFDHSWVEVSQWRGIHKSYFEELAVLGKFGWCDSFPGLGGSYCFVSTSPPIFEIGLAEEERSIMGRSAFKGEKDLGWKSVGKCPIWVPEWNLTAKKIFLFEGQWDAICFWMVLRHFKLEERAHFQVMALVGPKNLKDYPELLEYFNNKELIQVPDADPKNERGIIAGEKILIDTHRAIQNVNCIHKVLRLPKQYRKHKDFNEWWKHGITIDDFELWMACADPFYESNGIIIDSEFREQHKLNGQCVVEVSEEGRPIELIVARPDRSEAVTYDELIALTKHFPLLNEYLIECRTCNEGSPFWDFMAFMTYHSALVGRRTRFCTGIYGNIYSMFVGHSASGKTRAIYTLYQMVNRLMPDLMTSDRMSEEALMDELKDCNQRLMTINEIGVWMGKGDMNYKSQVVTFWKELYDCHIFSDGGAFRTRFKKTGKQSIENPFFTIIAGATEECCNKFSMDELTTGVVGRFFFVHGKKRHSFLPNPGKLSQKFKDRYMAFYKNILLTPIRDDQFMRWSPSVQPIYDKLYNEICEKQESFKCSPAMKTYYGRWGVQMIKVGMNLETMREDRQWPLETAEMGICELTFSVTCKVVNFLEQYFVDLFKSRFEEDEVNYFSKNQKRIIRYLERNANQNGTRMGELLRSAHISKRDFDLSIETLKESGMIMIKEVKTIGRPSKTVYLIKDKQ